MVRVGMLLADVDDARRAQLVVEVAIGQLVSGVAVDHAMRQRDRLGRALFAVARRLLRFRLRRGRRRRVRAAGDENESGEELSHRASILRRPMQLITRDLPGTGGLHKATPDDFIVDELPAYA